MVGIAAASPGLGSPAAAQAPLGLLVASRSSSLRMAMALGTMLAPHAIRQRQLCREGCASPTRAREGIVHNTNQWVLAAVPAARVVAATCYGVSVWRATPPTALYGNIILGAAAILMLASGCRLIALSACASA
jgi:hypothetical protein